jgi:hypothetical protein
MTVPLPNGRRVEINEQTGEVEVFSPLEPGDSVSFAISDQSGVLVAEARRKGQPWTSWSSCVMNIHAERYGNSVSVSARGPNGVCPILALAPLQPE